MGDMTPRAYDLGRPEERLRLLQEVAGYLRCCHREHHGTDFAGRTHALAALQEWVLRLERQAEMLPFPELRDLLPHLGLQDRVQCCPDCRGIARVDPPCSRCYGSGLILGVPPATRTVAGQRYAVPPGTPATHCKGCNATIFFIVTEHGRTMPVDPDGVSHFATCPRAGLFRKRG
jgi:hypothetical protein